MTNHYALLTDLYELTMAQGYFLQEMHNPAVFDMFFRKTPFKGGFAVFAGLGDLLKAIENMQFSTDELDYLASLKIFKKPFLDFLITFRFKGKIHACEEGTLVFPGAPLIRVEGTLIEAQLLESLLLNIINYQTLIATKAARLYLASRKGVILEFGLRRAQGINGALSAARAAFIGGAAATSNTLAAKLLGIPVKGTMAHSWIMAFPTEYEAFDKYAELYPDNCTLLVDTYNTLSSGIINAVKVLSKLKAGGHTDYGVRLDSGNLLRLSREVREILDQADLKEAKIVVSNDLDEQSISRLIKKKAPIDIWGVGTNLVTGHPDAALTGVYKLAMLKTGDGWKPVYKLSDDKKKRSLPGIKQLYRYSHGEFPLYDIIGLESGERGLICAGRKNIVPDKKTTCKPLLTLKMEDGRITTPSAALPEIRQHTLGNLQKLQAQHRKLEKPAEYMVYLSRDLCELILKRNR